MRVLRLIKAIRARLNRKKNRFRRNTIARLESRRYRVRKFIRMSATLFILLAVSMAFIFTYDYFTQTRNFQTRRIVVTGCDRLSEEEILEVSGLTPGVNLLSINLTTTRKRILNHPWVAEATVSREIPSELHIRIQEEDPLAILEMADGGAFLVNRSGRIFKRKDPSDPDLRPRVTGLDYRDLPVPEWPDTHAFKTVIEMVREMPHLSRETEDPAGVTAQIHHVRMDPQIGATAYLGEGECAVLMGFGPYSEKYAALSGLLERMRAERHVTDYLRVDLFDVNRIVITPVPVELSRSTPEEVNIAGT